MKGLFRGTIVPAHYQPPQIRFYRNNPFLEALGPIRSDEEIARGLIRKHDFDATEDPQQPAHVRYHLIKHADQFFAPSPEHIELARKISVTLYDGYLARNPLHDRSLHQRVEALTKDNPPDFRSTASSFAFCGISGSGKSTTIEMILRLHPQVIDHHEYHGTPLIVRQLVWLKIETPPNGSMRGLCTAFFNAVDALLTTNYTGMYAKSTNSANDMLPLMALVAGLHGLGLLIIDEIQNLNQAASGGADVMLNFFVKLNNLMGLPVILVGTFKALPILNAEFRNIRRVSAQGFIQWERMPFDKTWARFMDAMWRCQYTWPFTPLTPELSQAFYDETQGITDLVVKLYYLTQCAAIRRGGTEELTVDLVRRVARRQLSLSWPVIDALRNEGKEIPWKRLVALGDVIPPNLGKAIDDLTASPPIRVQSASSHAPAPAPIKPKRPRKLAISAPLESKCELVTDLLSPDDSTKTVYEKAEAAGCFRPVSEFFEESAA